MKKVIYLSFFLFILFPFNKTIHSQQASIDLIVFQDLSEVSFAAFALADVPGGNSRIFAVNIAPVGNRVIVEGRIAWKKDLDSGFRNLFTFKTHTFIARSITNLDLGRGDIRIDQSTTDSDLAEENLTKGKPTGSYQITVRLLNEQGQLLDSDTETLSFTNPTQTLTIRNPQPNSQEDIGGIMLQWERVIGATGYKIYGNVRTNQNQSLEEALNTGSLLVDSEVDRNFTMVNLRNHLQREWLPGQEVVVQVSALVSGAGNVRELKSNIVNFFIGSSDSPETAALRTRMVSVISSLSNIIGADFLEMLRSGEIDMSTLRIVDDNGRRISLVELERILTYLQTNPDALINADFNQR